LRQVTPITKNILSKINKNLVSEGETYINWEKINTREWSWEEGKFNIEPGENDLIHADFVISLEIKAYEIYCYIENPQEKIWEGQYVKFIILKLTSIRRNEIMANKQRTDDISSKAEVIKVRTQQEKQQSPQKRGNSKKEDTNNNNPNKPKN